MDKKLNFKKHVQTRIASATRALHSILGLMNSERGLAPAAARQLYLSCIVPISDYGSELWYNNQVHFENSFSKLQNTAMRKILGVFKTTPIDIMEIECNLMPSKLRLMQKTQKYALRIAKIGNKTLISKIVPNTFSKNFECTGFDEEIWKGKFAKWNENAKTIGKKYPSHFYRVLNSISHLINEDTALEKPPKAQKPWKNHILPNIVVSQNKESAKIDFYKRLKLLQDSKNSKSKLVFYTDGSKETNGAAAVVFVPKSSLYNRIKHQNSRLPLIQNFDNEKYFGKNWNLGEKSSNDKAEKFALWKSTSWALKACNQFSFDKNIWIFTDSQSSINALINLSKPGISEHFRQNIEHLHRLGFTVNIQWIPGHMDICGNEAADKLAKAGQNLPIVENLPISYDCIKNQIKQNSISSWENQWAKSKVKNSQYRILGTVPGSSNLKYLSSITDKLTFATIIQLKIGHGYFRSFQRKLSIWKRNNDFSDNFCTGNCREVQTPKHLLLQCKNYQKEISELKNSAKSTVNFEFLINTKIGQKLLVKYLQTTKIATRKWLLGQTDD